MLMKQNVNNGVNKYPLIPLTLALYTCSCACMMIDYSCLSTGERTILAALFAVAKTVVYRPSHLSISNIIGQWQYMNDIQIPKEIYRPSC